MKKELENFKIDPENIKNRVNATLNADLRERRLYMKHKIFNTAAIVASLTAVFAASAFAMSSEGQEVIGNIISYFQNDRAIEITSIEELAKYNKEIGKSITKDGYTLTLDNVAADDNFIHVFYTIKSDSVPFYEGESSKAEIYGDAVNARMNVEVVINGVLAGYGTNHNSYDGYFADNYTYKAAAKYNIAAKNISDNFRVELFGDMTNLKAESVFNKLYKDEYEKITEADKSSAWYVSADVDKSKVKVDSFAKDINQKMPWSGANIEKVIFSPFGNQLVITTDAQPDPDKGFFAIEAFALFDENDKCLDVLNTDLSMNNDGSSRNSFEFLKADKNLKQLKFVPLENKAVPEDAIQEIKQKIGAYPLTYQVNDYGKIVVTDIRVSDGEIAIDYYKDGFVMYDPGFMLLNDDGDNAEPGGKLGCTQYIDVNYEDNCYTARYVYDKMDDKGNPIPADESVSAQKLAESFTTLGVFTNHSFALDFDNTLTVDLK